MHCAGRSRELWPHFFCQQTHGLRDYFMRHPWTVHTEEHGRGTSDLDTAVDLGSALVGVAQNEAIAG
jgi:hypothetical protein